MTKVITGLIYLMILAVLAYALDIHQAFRTGAPTTFVNSHSYQQRIEHLSGKRPDSRPKQSQENESDLSFPEA